MRALAGGVLASLILLCCVAVWAARPAGDATPVVVPEACPAVPVTLAPDPPVSSAGLGPDGVAVASVAVVALGVFLVRLAWRARRISRDLPDLLDDYRPAREGEL